MTKYISLILVLISAACSDETMRLEEGLARHDKVTFAANSSRLVTKAGLRYTNFDTNTRYLLYAIEEGADNWTDAVMYCREGREDENQLIDYGEDFFFDGRRLDFLGATLCSTDELPINIDGSSSPEIDFNISAYGQECPDLMYSNNLRGCTAQTGLLEMNFIHALSKVQIEVSRQDMPSLEGIKVKSVSLTGTSSKGELDLVGSRWKNLDTEGESILSDEMMTVGTDPAMLQNNGDDAYALIIPNEDSGNIVGLKITLVQASGTEKTYTYPLYDTPATDDEAAQKTPFIFEQNHRYVLSVILLSDGVRVLAVSPQAYEWVDEEVDAYMGQPVNFGGLMWMDRNLGAYSADCENDWRNTRGFYYQFGRNIPYIFDDDKFINRPTSDTRFTDTNGGTKTLRLASGYKTGDRGVNLDIGYEYFFTYNDKGEKVYGAVQGGTLNGQDRFFVEGEWDGYTWKGTKLFTWLNPNQTYYRSNDGTPLTQAWNFYNAAPVEYDSENSRYVEKYSATWDHADVTSSNIAINPGDSGLYHFIIDARYYTDFYQSGSWCVLDHGDGCSCETDPNGSGYNQFVRNRNLAITEANYISWLKSGCQYTTVEDAAKVNNLWATKKADGSFHPNPENHPCPKGWRIPTGEDFASILPDPSESFYASWGEQTKVRDLILMSNASGKKTSHKEDILYGKEYRDASQNEVCHTIYIIKRKGESDCYRLRLKWYQSNLSRTDYYKLGKDEYSDAYGPNMQYVEISKYPGSADMKFSDYKTETFKTSSGSTTIYKKLTESEYWQFHADFDDWETPTETMQIPLAGFIYTGAGLDCLYFDGAMTILRCTDWNNSNDLTARIREAGITNWGNVYNKCNEAQNWCAYLRTDNAQCGVFDGSRKSLGCQIRCVRDINAK